MRHPILKKSKEQALITIDANTRDYSKDPLVVKKVERARAFIAKHGLPKDKHKNAKSKKS